jgi:hypothetical protein
MRFCDPIERRAGREKRGKCVQKRRIRAADATSSRSLWATFGVDSKAASDARGKKAALRKKSATRMAAVWRRQCQFDISL